MAKYQSFSPAEISADQIEGVVALHAEEAAFLWLLRDAAVRAPHYALKDLAKLDERIEANLDGLRVAGDTGWEFALKALEEGKGGEAFAATILALESGQAERAQKALELSSEKRERCRGLVSALAWLPWGGAEAPIRLLAGSPNPVLRRMGIAAAAHQRQDLGQLLEDALRSKDPLVMARAIQTVGELGQVQRLAGLQKRLMESDASIRFAAAWTLALRSPDDLAVSILRTFAESQLPIGDQAVQVAARRIALADAERWRTKLLIERHTYRRAVMAAGAAGDPAAIPFLFDSMKSPKMARLAGEAFSLITGVDLALEDLEAEPPDGFDAILAELPEEEKTSLEADANLPWPAAAALARWWQGRQARYAKGQRYIVGKPIAAEWLFDVLRTAKQRQRQAAALELTILQPGRPHFPTFAPGPRQQQQLGG